MTDTRPCPACPDGYVWYADGSTGKTCPTCNGYAEVNMDGSPVGPAKVIYRPWGYRKGEDE